MRGPEQSAHATRVLLVDDHVVLRDGLQALITAQTDMEVVGTAATAVAAVRLCGALQPDVVLLDIKLPDGNGIQVTRELRQQSLPVRVLLLTAYAAPQYVRAARRLGVAGFLLKESGASQVLEAVRAVARGESVYNVQASLPTTAPGRPGGGALLDPLSDREREVLRLLASGARNETIAVELGISPRTVDGHVSTILGKLGASSRGEAVTAAEQLGLL